MAPGQESPTPPVLRVESQLVILDTVVADRQGNIVHGLHKGDFTVYENAVPQTIKDFSSSDDFPPIPDAPRKDRNGHDDWGASPLTIIIVDEMDTSFEELAYARDCVANYLKAQPPELRYPTALLWLSDRGIHELTPFTRDRETVLTALRRQPSSYPGRLMRGDVAEQIAASFAALQQTAVFSRGQAGKKEIIWVGRSFPSVDPIGLDDYQRTLLAKAVHSTADLLLASRASVYVVDPTVTGSSRDDDTAQEVDTLQLATAATVKDPFASSFNIDLFVNETGGKCFRGRNDLDQQIVTSEARGLSYYTLTYVPSSSIRDGAYRQIDVRMRDPNLRAQTKRGYYAEAPASATPPTKLQASLDASDLRFDLYEAAVTGMQYTGVGLHVESCSRDVSQVATCVVSVDTNALTFTQLDSGDERTTLLSVVACLDSKGKLINNTINRLIIAIPQQQVAAIATGFSKLHLQTVVPPRATAVRIVVRDSSGRIGTADVPTDQVPHLVAQRIAGKSSP